MPMVVLDEADKVGRVVEALLHGGISVIEIGLRTPAALEAIALASQQGAITVAAGTVTSAQQVSEAIAAGASFGLSPSSTQAVLSAVKAANWPFLPAIATLTEANTALDLGFVHQKVYPADLLGAEKFMRSLGAVLPQVKLLPSGGVTEANLASYLSEPNVFSVTGTWIAPRALIVAGDFAEIARRAKKASEIASAHG